MICFGYMVELLMDLVGRSETFIPVALETLISALLLCPLERVVRYYSDRS